MKDGDRIVMLANLIEMEEMAKKRETLAKHFRLAMWKLGQRLLKDNKELDY